jgi:hypothetical protein
MDYLSISANTLKHSWKAGFTTLKQSTKCRTVFTLGYKLEFTARYHARERGFSEQYARAHV